jgi:hypothetical protein
VQWAPLPQQSRNASRRICATWRAEIKAAFINTNVLTREFLTKIDDEVRRSSTVVRQLSDVAEANWRSSSRDSNFGGSGEATKLSPTSSQAVAQTLVRTCQNIVALLDTNLAQATEHERRLSLLLTQNREDVADDLIEFEREGGGAAPHFAYDR